MKVLLVSNLGSTHTVRWANGLRERGHDVCVFSLRKPTTGLNPEVRYFVYYELSKVGYLLFGYALKRLIRTEQPDVVHAHRASGFGSMCSLWLKRNSYILSMWGADIYEFPTGGPIRRWTLELNLRRAGTLLSTSHSMAQEAQKYTTKQVHITPFGVDMGKFRPNSYANRDDATFRIGTVKHLQYRAGIDTLIEAFTIFRNERWRKLPAELFIVGDGPERNALGTLASNLGVSDSVKFLGRVPNDAIPKFLKGLDVFCFLSRVDESFGVAAVEASACGIPVVASRVGGLHEVVEHGRTGFIVPKESPEKAAACFAALYQDASLRSRMGQEGRNYVSARYSLSGSLDIMEQVYEDWLAQCQLAPKPR